MSDVKLTREADILIVSLYRKYLLNRDSGIPKLESKLFGDVANVQKEIVARWNIDDINETLLELSRSGLLHTRSADNYVTECWISDLGIYYMENRFKNGLAQVINWLAEIKSILL